ncbi:MAG: DUF4395 family protein [Thermoanaerobaculia bacterium]
MNEKLGPRQAERNFILQQGLDEPATEACPMQYSALQFQPRLVGLWVLLGILLQSPLVFLILSAVLWWNALFPRGNPFDAVYNATRGTRPGALRLRPAPGPRRFAQGMAGTFALAIGISLARQWRTAAYVLEALLLTAVGALVIGRFYLGSFVFHLLRGRAAFAMRTLPWARG